MYKLQHSEILVVIEALEAKTDLTQFEKDLITRLKHFTCTKIAELSQNG
jgi:hypothetical protein